jgi:hypothetical protein
VKVYKKDSENYFEVSDKFYDGNSYLLRVHRYLSSEKPYMNFRDDVYFKMTPPEFDSMVECSEDHFVEAIEQKLVNVWKDSEYFVNGCDARRSYMLTYNIPLSEYSFFPVINFDKEIL